MRRNLRFTLIELLVVVSIIAILAAMLLPALAKAKLRVKGTKCVHNHKQLAMMIQLYMDDAEGFLPTGFAAGFDAEWPWQNFRDHPAVVNKFPQSAAFRANGSSPAGANAYMSGPDFEFRLALSGNLQPDQMDFLMCPLVTKNRYDGAITPPDLVWGGPGWTYVNYQPHTCWGYAPYATREDSCRGDSGNVIRSPCAGGTTLSFKADCLVGGGFSPDRHPLLIERWYRPWAFFSFVPHTSIKWAELHNVPPTPAGYWDCMADIPEASMGMSFFDGHAEIVRDPFTDGNVYHLYENKPTNPTFWLGNPYYRGVPIPTHNELRR